MKKSFLSLLLALLLTLGAFLPSCADKTPAPNETPKQTTSDNEKDKSKDHTEKTPSEPKDLPPDGYLFAQDGALRFAFPADWVEDITSESLAYEHPTKLSFLTLEMTDASEDEFQSMTAEEYEEFIAPSFSEELGGSIFSVTAKHVTNQNGLDVAFFSCFATLEGLTLKQLLYAVNIGDTSYRLVFLLEETSEEFEQTVLDSLKEVTPIEPDPNAAPRGYRFYTKDDLRFLYPAGWDADTLTDPETSESIKVNQGYSAAYFTEMDQDLFDEIIGKEMQSAGFSVENLVIEDLQNTNGIDIHTITYSLSAEGYDKILQQHIFAFTLNGTAYALALTMNTQDGVLAQKIFDSIENLHPSPTPAQGATSRHLHLNLQFCYPARWGVDYQSNQTYLYQGKNSIALSSRSKNTIFETMTQEEFERDHLPTLEQELGVPISDASLGGFTTQEGLVVATVQYSFELYGITFQQLLYIVTVDQTTHMLILTATSQEAINELNQIVGPSLQELAGPNYGESQ